MTTTIIISLIALFALFAVAIVLGARVSDLKAEARTLRIRVEWLETDLVAAKKQGSEDLRSLRSEINALAGTVAANADRCTRLEGNCCSRPPQPASPQTYIADTYPKRADEV